MCIRDRLEAVRPRLPELPAAKRKRFVEQYSVTSYDANELVSDLALANYFEAAARNAKKPKTIANWIMNDLRSKLNLEGKTVESCLIKPEEMSNLANKIEEGTINRHQANQSLYWMYHEGYSADEARCV